MVRENGTSIRAGNGKVLTRLGDIVLIDDPFVPDGGTIFERVGNMTRYIQKFLQDNP
ncbi:hypothetical protein U14_01408 [Candidatus Moduliflexus flocculans]|uniref:Uncharacterized protein n=1 Tax=Candidatus Moduliflexus flocculans TaxID=1499966 RepID=A0A0S6VS39_9BACT|nr:hypothetical protein U14_01408 [Candidatus Moduliflexus flocculans]